MAKTDHPLRAAAAVTGIGETAYSRSSGRGALALELEAALLAIEDAGLKPADIDGVIPMLNGAGIADDYVANFGFSNLRIAPVAALGGASCVAALQYAAMAIAAGVCNHVLLALGRNGASGPRTSARVAVMPHRRVVAEFEGPVGVFAPAQLYAPMARRHMELYGTTSRQFGAIAVSARNHARLNGNAVMVKPMTLEDHRDSRMIVDPFRLLDCCIESDGAAAVVLSRADHARHLDRPPVILLGAAEGHIDSPGAITQRPDMTRLGIASAAERAFAMAGVTRDEIDVAEIYDCFTYIVLCQLEDLGFCKKGEGGAFVESGAIGLGGRLPVNTHGGLLSQSHMGGMNHIVELVRQLRGAAGKAQVAGARTGLVTGYGDLGAGSIAIMRAGER